MKEITKTSRLAGQLEKLFRMLNEDFFNGQLETPVITIQSSSRSYGHYSVAPIWSVNGEELKHEINIAAGTLNRPIENVVATLLHEMVHMFNDTVLNLIDTSRSGTYHNKLFKQTAESVGLIVSKSETYGYAHTAPSDELIEWILENNIQEIRINRNEGYGFRPTGGSSTRDGATATTGKSKSNSIKHQCPVCGNSCRATKRINIMCADCLQIMVTA